ncbi:MAG: ADP-ribosylglycohydrolase [Lachnospiraceae bacterium]|jgi:ADP-ribosylglycohydrolase|nr:ADP-ribosylglycohydrolase [Lachnospiraceae bacterium]
MSDKLRDAIFGLAIGDALGVPYEFKARGSFTCTDMVGFGTHNQPLGTWSDDTAMALATMMAIKNNDGSIVIDEMRENFVAWLQEGSFTANGDVFDVGNATWKALKTGQPCVGPMENGNGSLMRILPLAFTGAIDEEIRAVSAITHGHPISKEACVIYVEVARRLLDGELIGDILRTLYCEHPFERLCHLTELPESEIKSSGFVVDTLEAALWAVCQATNADDPFADAVLRAVNLGEDTDTVGAVAGGLAGIAFGLDGQGEKWAKQLRNRELILECMW